MRRWRRITTGEVLRVRAMRAEEGLTWKEIGARLGRDPSAFLHHLRTRRNPFAQYLVRRGAGL